MNPHRTTSERLSFSKKFASVRVLAGVGLVFTLSHGLAAQDVFSRHVELGELAINTIQADRNAYGTASTLVISGVNGKHTENNTKCSPFVTLVLKLSYDLNDAFFKSWCNSANPTSAKYHDAIRAGNKFFRISKIGSVQPGDLIAIKYLTGKSPGRFGHIMVALAAPESMAPVEPIVESTEQYQVLIMDSTKTPHGTGDSRIGTSEQGLGKGYVRLYANGAGEIVGHTWTRSTGSTFHAVDQRPVAVGRLTLP